MRPFTPWGLLVGFGLGAAAALAAAAPKAGPLRAKPQTVFDDPAPAVQVRLGFELARAGGFEATLAQVAPAIKQALGFAPASLSVREDDTLPPEAYALDLKGLTVAQGRVRPGKLLALPTGAAAGEEMPGEPGVEPASGRLGAWVDELDAGRARLMGFDVLEAPYVVALHADLVVRRHLHELLTREETFALLEHARTRAPQTVAELQARLEPAVVQAVLQRLLREHVALKDVPAVAEALADGARQSQDPAELTERVRHALKRQLSAAHADAGGHIAYLPLGTGWEAVAQGGEAARALLPELRRRLVTAKAAGRSPVLVAPAGLRAAAAALLEAELPELAVLAEAEIDPLYTLQPVTEAEASAPAGT